MGKGTKSITQAMMGEEQRQWVLKEPVVYLAQYDLPLGTQLLELKTHW